MSPAPTDAAAAWVYNGLWGAVTRWFRVPTEPPTLPIGANEQVRSFRPARGFLSYLRFQFWIWLMVSGLVATVAWGAVLAKSVAAAVLLLPVAVVLLVVSDVTAYLAIHLRYNTTWYVMTDRALRMRRGIWMITEVTLTFENVQNVKLSQGPLQRHFGIADLEIQTAGGGGGANQGPHGKEGGGANVHRGLVEGVADAREIRDQILSRLRQSQSAGLGDEEFPDRDANAAFGPAHIQILEEIRDALATK